MCRACVKHVKAVNGSTFSLDATFRDRLNEMAREQYSSEQSRDVQGARETRKSLLTDVRAIGIGAGRIVYPLPERAYNSGEHDRYVLKIARPNTRYNWDGIEQNRRETTLWRDGEYPSLVPVVAADSRGYWLVMPRGDTVSGQSAEIEAWLDDTADALASTLFGMDLSAKNVVVLDGQFRLCDYGVPSRDATGDG